MYIMAPPAPGINQATGVWKDPSPHPSGSSIFSNSERLKWRGSQPCRTGSAALWAAYIPKEPHPPDATHCYLPPRPNVCVCVCLISSNGWGVIKTGAGNCRVQQRGPPTWPHTLHPTEHTRPQNPTYVSVCCVQEPERRGVWDIDPGEKLPRRR